MAETKINRIDMTTGALLPKLLLFALPVAATSILSLLFNAADVVVVGKFAGSNCMGAVGATGAMVNLLVASANISLGSNVLVARYLGCKREDEVSTVVHTSIVLGLILGIATTILGLFLSEPILVAMNTPDELLPLSVKYLKIYFLGMPAAMVYAFGAAILRANGDTKRPLYYLIIAGTTNVVLNLVMVLIFHKDVEGVAIATVVSQTVSVVLLLRCLFRCTDCCRLELKKLRLSWKTTLQLLQIGVPASLQSMMFNIANIITQSAINSFGTAVVAANTASGNIDGFVCVGVDAMYQGALTFTSQNYGAGNYDRIGKTLRTTFLTSTVLGLVLGCSAYLFRHQLLGIYVSVTDPNYEAIIEAGVTRMRCTTLWYFTYGAMMSIVGAIRGMGKSWTPMLITMFGTCVLRIVWIYTAFRSIGTVFSLYLLYPISWVVTGIAQLICYVLTYGGLKKRAAASAVR